MCDVSPAFVGILHVSIMAEDGVDGVLFFLSNY